MFNNILGYIPSVYTIETQKELIINPTYDINANKPWWKTMWASMLKWFYNLNPIIKIGIGITFLALAILISIKVYSGINEAIPFIVGVIGKTSSSIYNVVVLYSL